MGMTPSFSPSMGSENRLKASRMSASSCALILCSFASLDWRGFGADDVPASAGRRLGGCKEREDLSVRSEDSREGSYSPWLLCRARYRGIDHNLDLNGGDATTSSMFGD